MILLAAPNWNAGQVEVTTTAALVLAAAAGQLWVKLKNIDDTDTIYIGDRDATVTASNSMPLEPGESIELPVSNSIYALASANTPRLAYVVGTN